MEFNTQDYQVGTTYDISDQLWCSKYFFFTNVDYFALYIKLISTFNHHHIPYLTCTLFFSFTFCLRCCLMHHCFRIHSFTDFSSRSGCFSFNTKSELNLFIFTPWHWFPFLSMFLYVLTYGKYKWDCNVVRWNYSLLSEGI